MLLGGYIVSDMVYIDMVYLDNMLTANQYKVLIYLLIKQFYPGLFQDDWKYVNSMLYPLH